MKVIGFTGNYGIAAGENGPALPPQCYLMADSSILYSGRPWFIPDWAGRYVAVPAIAVRTGRLGKCIAPKFARRYWDALTACLAVRAVDSDDACLLALDRAMDGAAVVGEWVEAAGLDDPLQAVVEVKAGETVLSRCRLADMSPLPLDEMLARLSTRCSIKMGDVLVTGECGAGHTLVAGDRLTASVDGRPVLDVKVRL